MNKNLIDISNKVYNIILNIDHNIQPFILTLGSVLFKFIEYDKNTDGYFINTKVSLENIKNYYLFSEENLCNTYKFLKENGLIYYNEQKLKYYINNKLMEI